MGPIPIIFYGLNREHVEITVYDNAPFIPRNIPKDLENPQDLEAYYRGRNGIQYQVEVCLRYPIQQVYKVYGKIILVVV